MHWLNFLRLGLGAAAAALLGAAVPLITQSPGTAIAVFAVAILIGVIVFLLSFAIHEVHRRKSERLGALLTEGEQLLWERPLRTDWSQRVELWHRTTDEYVRRKLSPAERAVFHNLTQGSSMVFTTVTDQAQEAALNLLLRRIRNLRGDYGAILGSRYAVSFLYGSVSVARSRMSVSRNRNALSRLLNRHSNSPRYESRCLVES